jgi:hypothetical protein
MHACYLKFIFSTLQKMICYGYLANLKKHGTPRDGVGFQNTVYLCQFTCLIQVKQKIIKLIIKILLQQKHNKILTTHRSKHFCCIKINSQIKLSCRCIINQKMYCETSKTNCMTKFNIVSWWENTKGWFCHQYKCDTSYCK